MSTSYIITFIGDDRPGLVEQLSATIEDCGGNWHESRLSQLGGKFAGLIRVTLDSSKGSALEASLKALSASGLSVRVTPLSDTEASATSSANLESTRSVRTLQLAVVGPDRPGIVREVSRALAAQGINVLEMDSAVISAAMSGELLFQSSIAVSVEEDTDMDRLGERLEDIANAMTLDIDLDNT